jgi:hypothetical protein
VIDFISEIWQLEFTKGDINNYEENWL